MYMNDAVSGVTALQIAEALRLEKKGATVLQARALQGR